ncbi:MAG: glutamyl-tRNA(Gln) amidotransferase subunit A [Candidatus Tectimicrobiota bacterium]|nr:MAG: glutamyl-tRNA(Gln) amidotransferase subunit A [Candidatus Tectomicrobia bacterium]
MSELAFLSATETARLVACRQVTAEEVTRAYLERIERLDATLHAYITVLPEAALAAAREVDRRLQRGEAVGPLGGVPVAVKDQFWTAGVATTNGSHVYRDFVPHEDATTIARLKQAGAVLLGKLNMSELAMGGTRQPPWGIPRNPWDLERTPGESSSGSGVALAAHLCAASLGEDTGGSGRGPAAYCGVVGLRPTFTRVSRHGMTPMCWFLDAAAPMGKAVADCALLLEVIAGYDPRDPFTSRRPVPAYRAELGRDCRGLRLGLIRELYAHADMHPEVRQALDAALAVLRDLGAEVQEVSIPLVPLAGAIFVAIADTVGAAARHEVLRTRAHELDAATRTRLLAAALVPAKVYHRALQARVLLRQQFLQALRQVDVLVSATAPFPPPRHTDLTAPFVGREDVRARFFFRRAYTGCYALTALPALSVPCGFTREGLPIGLQLGAAPFAEGLLLRVAHAYEQATPWHRRRPPLPDA